MVSISSYHIANAAYHQQQFDSDDGLLAKGYRITSLSVYRQGNNLRYAAIWTHQKGPKWQGFHGLNSDEYQTFFDTWYKKGYAPIIVSATGGEILEEQTNTPIFAGIFEKNSISFIAKHNIKFKIFKETCEWAKNNSHILRWGAIYGGRNRLYAGIWEKVNNNVKWDYRITIAIDGPEVGVPLEMPQNPTLRLSFVTRSALAEYLAVYRNDQNKEIRERHGMTSSQYQTQHDLLKSQGYLPVCLQAGGDPRISNTPKFVAIFQKF